MENFDLIEFAETNHGIDWELELPAYDELLEEIE